MINKFRYKKPPTKESLSGTILGPINSDSESLNTNTTSKTLKVLDNKLHAIRTSDRINTIEDYRDYNEQGVLDENMKKQLHVRMLFRLRYC